MPGGRASKKRNRGRTPKSWRKPEPEVRPWNFKPDRAKDKILVKAPE